MRTAPGTAAAVALANATVTAMSLAKLKAAGLIAASLLIASALTVVVASAVVARAGASGGRRRNRSASTGSMPLAKSAIAAPRPAGFPYPPGWPLAHAGRDHRDAGGGGPGGKREAGDHRSLHCRAGCGAEHPSAGAGGCSR